MSNKRVSPCPVGNHNAGERRRGLSGRGCGFAIALVILLAVGCAHNSKITTVFERLKQTQAVYIAVHDVLGTLHAHGVISHEVWNGKVVPLDQKLNDTFNEAWELLRTYQEAQDANDLQRLFLLLDELDRLMELYRQYAQ